MVVRLTKSNGSESPDLYCMKLDHEIYACSRKGDIFILENSDQADLYSRKHSGNG